MQTMYNVAFSYDFSTVSVGVMAENEEQAEEEALAILIDGWGEVIRDYMSCDITSMFERSEKTTIHGRHLEKGTEFTVTGEGRMIFLAHVRNPVSGAEWVDCIDRDRKIRSFAVEQVKRVHYKKKRRV